MLEAGSAGCDIDVLPDRYIGAIRCSHRRFQILRLYSQGVSDVLRGHTGSVHMRYLIFLLNTMARPEKSSERNWGFRFVLNFRIIENGSVQSTS